MPTYPNCIYASRTNISARNDIHNTWLKQVQLSRTNITWHLSVQVHTFHTIFIQKHRYPVTCWWFVAATNNKLHHHAMKHTKYLKKFVSLVWSPTAGASSSSFMFRAPSVYLGCTAAWRLIVPALYSILTVPTFAARCLSASYMTRELQAAKGGIICGRETWLVNFA